MHSNVSHRSRFIVRSAFVLAGASLVLISSLLFLGTFTQNEKDQAVFADMKDRVAAVRTFTAREGRLPNDIEFSSLIASLPVRYYRYDYKLSDSPEKTSLAIEGLGKESKGGWVLYFWRGEWHEWYSSWNDHYSLANRSTLWKSERIVMCWIGLFGVGFLVLSRHKRLRNGRGAKELLT